MAEESPYVEQWAMRSKFGEEKPVTAAIASILSAFGCREERLNEVVTAVGEACLNAFEHGNRMNRDSKAEVRMSLTGQVCNFRIYDEGAGFEYAPEALDREVKRMQSDPRGWGLLFVSSFADRIDVGNEAGRFYVELAFLLE